MHSTRLKEDKMAESSTELSKEMGPGLIGERGWEG
jgi:hypothetical protein